MPRDIKFRIWNPSGNNMLYDISNVYECLMQQHVFDKTQPADRCHTMGYDHKADGMIWMQFVGIKAIGDIELYEDDVVRITVGNFKNRNMQICFYNGCFCMKVKKANVVYYTSFIYFQEELLKNIPDFDRDSDIGQFIEYVGNIHENPDLMPV